MIKKVEVKMKKANKNIIQKFLLIVIPILIIWIGLTSINLLTERKYTISKITNENEIYAKNTDVLVEKYLSEVIENLKVIRDTNELSDFINLNNQETYQEVTSMIVRIMSNKIDYDQIRYLDLSGNEIFRVENNDRPAVISKKLLQDKSNRYYFQNTINLDYDEVYISPLDLNVENDEIETPLKPIIRFSTPIFNEQEEVQGVIIINYRADYFVDLILEHQDHEDISDYNFYVLNKNGQYIFNPNEDLNYSYMYDSTKELSYSTDHAELWNEMFKNNFDGNYTDGKYLYSYYDVLKLSKERNSIFDESWIIVHEMDISDLFSLSKLFSELFLLRNLVILFLIITLTFAIAYVMNKLQSKTNELDITMKIANSTNDAIMITDNTTKISYVNKAYEKATGYQANEIIGLKPSDFKSGKNSEELYRKMWQSIALNGQWEGVLWDKKKNGLLYPKKLKIIAFKNEKTKRIHHYAGIFSDLQTSVNQTENYDNIDLKNSELTIPNEQMMIELLEQNISEKNIDFMVIYLSIVNYTQLSSILKDVNISQIFSEVIKPLLQKDDLFAQTGKNLFVLVIATNRLKNSKQEFIVEFHKKIGQVFTIKNKEIFFKTKIGVANWPDDTKDIKKLLLNAMIALDWTIYNNDSEISFFDIKMLEHLNYQIQIESQLRNAIKKKELAMVYQPQVDITTGKIVGMEALVRWNNEKLGFVSPAIFIPIAEKNHMMVDIGKWILKQVLKDLHYMKNKLNFNIEDLQCAINISVIQMEEDGFEEMLLRNLEHYDVATSQIEIEMTERLLLSNKSKCIAILTNLREKGIKVAIDDFGIGYSSLSYLHTLPIDKMKVDRSFIKDYPENDDGKLAKILVDMSKTLGMSVMTEGVETIEQINYLKKLECKYVQGYYYSRPLSLDDFILYANKNH